MMAEDQIDHLELPDRLDALESLVLRETAKLVMTLAVEHGLDVDPLFQAVKRLQTLGASIYQENRSSQGEG